MGKPISIASASMTDKIRDIASLRIIENLLSGSIGGLVWWGAQPEIPVSTRNSRSVGKVDKVQFSVGQPAAIRNVRMLCVVAVTILLAFAATNIQYETLAVAPTHLGFHPSLLGRDRKIGSRHEMFHIRPSQME